MQMTIVILDMFTISSRQCHCVHKCNTIGLSSVCVVSVFVPKVESGEQADVPKVELGEQRVNIPPHCIILKHILIVN